MKNLIRLNFALAFVTSIAGSACGSTTEAPGAPRFVAVGAAGTILSSPDGSSWSTESSGAVADLNSVASGPEVLVAVGNDGTILSSRNGSSWTKRASKTTTDLSHVVFDGEKFVAVGGSWETGAVTVKSIDGANWTSLESPDSHMFHAVAAVGGTRVAAAYLRSDLQTPTLFTSAVGSGSSTSDWSQRQGPDFYDSLSSGDEVLVVGESSVSRSRDGVTWTEQQLPARGRLVSSIASSSSAFVIVGEVIYSSPSGTTWIEQPAPAGISWLSGVAHGDALFVAVGGNGTVIASTDGTGWQPQATSTTQHLSDVAFGPGTLAW